MIQISDHFRVISKLNLKLQSENRHLQSKQFFNVDEIKMKRKTKICK